MSRRGIMHRHRMVVVLIALILISLTSGGISAQEATEEVTAEVTDEVGASSTPTSTASPAPSATVAATPVPAGQQTTYVVQPGDNLYRIAIRFNTTVSAIAQANGIVNPSLIYAGQRLVIP